MPKPLTRRERSFAAKYRRMLKAKDRGAAQYALADRLAYDLARSSKGELVRISAEKAIKAVDTMVAAGINPKRAETDMPKVWAHAAVRQYEIEEVKLPAE